MYIWNLSLSWQWFWGLMNVFWDVTLCSRYSSLAQGAKPLSDQGPTQVQNHSHTKNTNQ
jgi:hypothetical protein